jgi:hypothetical protein
VRRASVPAQHVLLVGLVHLRLGRGAAASIGARDGVRRGNLAAAATAAAARLWRKAACGAIVQDKRATLFHTRNAAGVAHRRFCELHSGARVRCTRTVSRAGRR